MKALVAVSAVAVFLFGCEREGNRTATSAPSVLDGARTLSAYLDRATVNSPDTPSGRYSREVSKRLQLSLQQDPVGTIGRMRRSGIIHAAARVPDQHEKLERLHAFVLGPRKQLRTIWISPKQGDTAMKIDCGMELRVSEIWEGICSLGLIAYIKPIDGSAGEVNGDIGSVPVISLPRQICEGDFDLSLEWTDGSRTDAMTVGRSE